MENTRAETVIKKLVLVIRDCYCGCNVKWQQNGGNEPLQAKYRACFGLADAKVTISLLLRQALLSTEFEQQLQQKPPSSP